MSFAKLPDGPMALFYTTRRDARLTGKIGGVPLQAAIDMVLKNTSVNGFLLQGNGDAWVAVKKDALKKFSTNH